MRRCRAVRTAVPAVTAVALWCAAAPGEAPPKDIQKRYWQVLPGVQTVAFDNLGNAWLGVAAGGSVAESHARPLKLMSSSQALLLGDRSGRLWVNARYKASSPTRMYDGKKWHKLAFRAGTAFESSSGRVFLFGAKQLHHVTKDGQWGRQKLTDKPFGSGWRIMEDGGGGVWMWAASGKPPARPPGAWVWRKGRWTHHTAKTGLPTDLVDAIVPMTGGRYLIVLGDKGASPNFVVWGPPKPSGRAVPKLVQHDFLPKTSAHRLRYEGDDRDGNRFLSVTGMIRGGQVVHPGETVLVYFTPAGEGRVLTTDGVAFLRNALRTRDRLHLSLTDRRFWDGRRLHRPPVSGSPLGIDRLGRIYYRSTRSNEVQVLWPDCERPGDLLRPTRQEGLGIGRAFQDSSGRIWFVGSRGLSGLLRWDARAWQPTPVKRLPHPDWTAEPAPPWNPFDRGLHVVQGTKGALLAATVRDIFQDAANQPAGRGGWRGLPQLAVDAAKAGKPVHWLEGWLWHAGRWAGPMKIDELVKERFATLRERLTLQTPRTARFDLQSDGERIWLVHDGQVRAWSAGGRVTPAWHVPHGNLANLVLMPQGKVWCIYPMSSRLEVVELAVAGGRIRATPIPAAGAGGASYLKGSRFRLTRGGQLWRWWHRRGGSGWYGLASSAFLWTGEAWQQQKGLGGLAFEDDDGALWFVRALRAVADRGYRIVRGDKAFDLRWPPQLPMGLVTKTRGQYLASCGRYIVSLEPAGKDRPGQWALGRVRLLADLSETLGVFLDGRGNLIGASGWTAQIPPPAPATRPAAGRGKPRHASIFPCRGSRSAPRIADWLDATSRPAGRQAPSEAGLLTSGAGESPQ